MKKKKIDRMRKELRTGNHKGKYVCNFHFPIAFIYYYYYFLFISSSK